MAGRRPKPTVLKKLAGNPGKRALNQYEAQFEPRMMSVPRFLDAEAKREWRRVVKELHTAGLLATVDRAALAAYCQLWSRWVKAEKDLQGKDYVVNSEKGGSYQNPLIGIANRAMADMRKFMIEFGMTPAARSKVRAEQPQEVDELDKLLFGQNVKVKK